MLRILLNSTRDNLEIFLCPCARNLASRISHQSSAEERKLCLILYHLDGHLISNEHFVHKICSTCTFPTTAVTETSPNYSPLSISITQSSSIKSWTCQRIFHRAPSTHCLHFLQPPAPPVLQLTILPWSIALPTRTCLRHRCHRLSFLKTTTPSLPL